jgi:pyrimidine operon attenuation protein/uracil phosphoribosyltransferase
VPQLPGNWQFVFLALELGGDARMAEKPGRQILNGEGIDEALDQMASSIYEMVDDKDNLVLVGIRTGGVYLANRIHEMIQAKTGQDVAVGILDIGLYRDDWTKLSTNPIVRSTELPVPIDERVVVLVDDVFFTGRTVRAAMDALIDFGRPKRRRRRPGRGGEEVNTCHWVITPLKWLSLIVIHCKDLISRPNDGRSPCDSEALARSVMTAKPSDGFSQMAISIKKAPGTLHRELFSV